MNIFEQATRSKVRFDSPKGLLSAEDLWDLPLTSNTGKANLDTIAVNLFKETKDDDISFVAEKTKSNEASQMRLDIVKRVIEVKVAERKAAAEAEDRKTKKQAIMALIERKQGEELASKPVEELMELLKNL